MVSAPVRVEQARFAQDRGIDLRRTGALTGVNPSSLYYRPRMPLKDEPVIKVMKEQSDKHPRFGFLAAYECFWDVKG